MPQSIFNSYLIQISHYRKKEVKITHYTHIHRHHWYRNLAMFLCDWFCHMYAHCHHTPTSVCSLPKRNLPIFFLTNLMMQVGVVLPTAAC